LRLGTGDREGRPCPRGEGPSAAGYLYQIGFSYPKGWNLDKGKLSTGANLLRLSTLGLNLALSIFAGLALGWGAQKIFHCGDWIMLVGTLLGIVAGYYGLFNDIKNLPKDKDKPSSLKP
jgi:hypothetical protein